MNIILKAKVKQHPAKPEFATVVVKTYINDNGTHTFLPDAEQITVPAENAQTICDLINAK